MFEDKDKNVIKITRFGGFIEFMNSKKMSKGDKEPFAIILEMMQEIKDDMKKGFSEVHSEIATIKSDMNKGFAEVHSEIAIIKECPTIKKELLELKNKK
ncbi:MAG: hypothetical protein HUJ42_02750, partial [Malacoplasma sp.]|nr:hypothetical protein [Malacoplasma sp.]